ncbi:carbohydrate-binding family 9-like protein [Negadavirga shengliensis]|uniref:Carbohydrate-binding family 9-like protein n=1 Tax=Negadavirga shengliensis TaxID=1389218 RepID=A0ABV9SVJ9_9BACT
MGKNIVFTFLLTSVVCSGWAQHKEDRSQYVAYRTPEKPHIDGLLDEAQWEQASWSTAFVDIEGDQKPKPAHLTRMKMLWDEEYLYIGLWLEEPHVWASYTENESVIFHENDIELFLDPDGDTHHYYELEVNALGTIWDLMLTKPYRNGGKPINGWNINGLEYAIHLEGSLNDPTDQDEYWSVEMAIPWKSLSQSGPRYRPPHDGEQWRINFSRVQWQVEPDEKGYKKKINPATGKPFPEDNWVWSPMGLVDMHLPERWGYVQFSDLPVGKETVPFKMHPDELVKDELRKIYWAQRDRYAQMKTYGHSLEELGLETGLKQVNFEVSATRFKISSPSLVDEKSWFITEDSRIWKE